MVDWFELMSLLLVIIVTCACVFVIVNRICKCLENRMVGKAYNEYLRSVGENPGEEAEGLFDQLKGVK